MIVIMFASVQMKASTPLSAQTRTLASKVASDWVVDRVDTVDTGYAVHNRSLVLSGLAGLERTRHKDVAKRASEKRMAARLGVKRYLFGRLNKYHFTSIACMTNQRRCGVATRK